MELNDSGGISTTYFFINEKLASAQFVVLKMQSGLWLGTGKKLNNSELSWLRLGPAPYAFDNTAESSSGSLNVVLFCSVLLAKGKKTLW